MVGSFIPFLQNCPDAIDVPLLVSPKTDKLDLEHFFRDLQKYKPWLSASAWNAWEDFRANAADLTSISKSCPWEMPSLVSAAIIAAADTHLDQPLAADITALIAKETQVPSKVCGVYRSYCIRNFLHTCVHFRHATIL